MTGLSERAAGATILVLVLVAALVVPLFSPYDPAAFVAAPMQQPSPLHPFGTDEVGRDVFVRVFLALRVNFAIVLATVALSMLIGVTYGVLAGLSPAPVREFLQRVVDAVIAIPYLIFVLAIVAFTRTLEVPILPPGVAAIVLALVINGWANYARIATAQVQQLAQRESIAAARLLGYSPARIVLRHMVPVIAGPTVSLAGSHAVLVTAAAAALSFLGAGVAPPTPELGAIMQGGTPLLATAWWISISAGVAVVIMSIGFSLIADHRRR